MPFHYRNLWKLLIDRDLSRQDLQEMTSLSSATMQKLANHENVTVETLVRVCSALDCTPNDVLTVETGAAQRLEVNGVRDAR